MNGLPLRPIDAEARRALTLNPWQGNVRELENTIHRATLLANGMEIGIEALQTPDGEAFGRAPSARLLSARHRRRKP